jgi:hypothetical protein
MRLIALTLLVGMLASGYVSYGQYQKETLVASANDSKAVLEKFVQAYSGLDDKALTALADKPETIAATLKEMQEFKQAGVQPALTITPLQTRSEKELTAIDALVSLSVKDKYLYRNGPALYMFKDGKLTGIKKNFNPAFVSSFWQAVLQADKIGVLESADRASLKELLTDDPLHLGFVMLAQPCIGSVVAMGEFRNPLEPQELKYWQDMPGRRL